MKRGEIPVKDLQLSKHRVCPAAARAQSPESASPERVPPPRLRAPAIPDLDQSTPPERSPETGDGSPKATQPVVDRAGWSLRTLLLVFDTHTELGQPTILSGR